MQQDDDSLDDVVHPSENAIEAFEFDDADAFFNDLPPIISDHHETDNSPSKEQPQETKREKLQLTKADLKRRDVPLFDCIYCVENAGYVMEGMLKKSLVTKYLDACREIAGNE